MNYYQNKKVFFYICPFNTPEDANYEHLIICLAEGLKNLGIEFYSSHNYWQLSPQEESYLLNSQPQVHHNDCNIVVLGEHWYRKYGMPEGLFTENRDYLTVFLDGEDGFRTLSWSPEFHRFDVILKAHYSSRLQYPDNCYPWAFGLSERILTEASIPLSFNHRKPELLVNFRHHPLWGEHSVRKAVRKKLLPQIESLLKINQAIDPQQAPPSESYQYLQWCQSGRRHYPTYYKRLQEVAACAAFGGFFLPPLIKTPTVLEDIFLRKIYFKWGLYSNRIIQWDSWRLWESLVTGCATFHVDFVNYGLLLPVMPENWQHYIGIDFNNIEETIKRLRSQPEILEKVAISGREWAIANYSPVPTAKRFLKIVEQIKLKNKV